MTKRGLFFSDSEMLTEIRNGNQQAFRQLFDNYWDDLYKVANKRLASPDDIKDILQEVFLSLWNNIHTIDVNDSIGGYLYISLKNKIFNYYEKKQNYLKLLVQQQFIPVESEDAVWNQFRNKEIRNLVAAKVAELPPKMQQIFLLSKTEHLTIAEIAALLRLSPQTVKNQLHKALERIREDLKRRILTIFFF